MGADARAVVGVPSPSSAIHFFVFFLSRCRNSSLSLFLCGPCLVCHDDPEPNSGRVERDSRNDIHCTLFVYMPSVTTEKGIVCLASRKQFSASHMLFSGKK